MTDAAVPAVPAVPVDTIQAIGGRQVFVCDPAGPVLASEADATDLVGNAAWQGAAWVLLPVARLSPEFFRLRSALAGALTQKFANYQLRLAVVGDISEHVAASNALRDFVRESNRGRQLWFLDDAEALRARLNALQG